jgi:hypothetical protein
MQATYPVAKTSIRPLILAFATSAALLLGGAGGYLVKGAVQSAPAIQTPVAVEGSGAQFGDSHAPAIAGPNGERHIPFRPQ